MDLVLFIVVISVLGPVLGSLIGVLRRFSFPYICNMLCFAAGVMLAISFLELIPESLHLTSMGLSVLGLAVGAALMYVLDRLIPHIHPRLCTQEQGCNLERTATFLVFGIFMHNFPEGMAIAVGSVIEAKTSLVIAGALAIHNIPEGICTSAPYFHSTGQRLKSFLLSSSTALPILGGFLFARYIFADISHHVMGMIIAGTAGLMIYITADELIPNACIGENHQTITWLMAGIILVMVLGGL